MTGKPVQPLTDAEDDVAMRTDEMRRDDRRTLMARVPDDQVLLDVSLTGAASEGDGS